LNRPISQEALPFLSAPFPQGISYQSLYPKDAAYPFLHDTALFQHQGRMILGWYNCTEGEICGDTRIRARWSENEGNTWGEMETIASSADQNLHYVPVSFGADSKNLYAFVTRMSGWDECIGYEILKHTHTGWESIALRKEPLLFNTPAYPLVNGHFLMAGRMSGKGCVHPEIPMVAISEGKSLLSPFRPIPLPGPWLQGEFPLEFPETAVIVKGSRITAFVRGQTFQEGENWRPLRFTSEDYGNTWSPGCKTNLPAIGSKLFGGVLKNGLDYLIFSAENDRMEQSEGRELLALAILSPDHSRILRHYRLLDGKNQETGLLPEWSYPCAMEYHNHLYISCTSGKKGAILMKIPIKSLEESFSSLQKLW